MAYLATYFLVAIVLCQSVYVFSRPQSNLDDFDFDQFLNGNNNNNNNNQQPTPPPSGTTTTTPSPQFTNCVNKCQITPQYAPVCGTNAISYYNVQRLRCAQGCGLSVEVQHVGTCRPSAGGK